MSDASERVPRLQEIVAKMSELALTPDGHVEDLEAAAGLLEELYGVVGSEDVGEPIAEAVRAGALSERQGRELLGIVPWTGRSNGADLQPTIDAWLLDGEDVLRVGLALAQGAFPFSTLEEMTAVLREIGRRFPEHAAACEDTIARRARQGV